MYRLEVTMKTLQRTLSCKPVTEFMREASTSMRVIAGTVLVTFTMLILEPAAMAAQATPASSPAQKTTPVQSDEEKLSDVMQRLDKKLAGMDDKLGKGQDTAGDQAELVTMKNEVNQLDHAVMANFQAIEDHIVSHQLPEVILQRHKDAVAKYQHELNTLRGNLDAIDQSATLEDRKLKVQQAKAHLKSAQHQRSQQPFDPNDLPNRSLKPNPDNKPKTDKKAFTQAGLHNNPTVKLAALGDFKFDKLPGASDPAYLAATPEVTLSQAIKDQAQALNYDPVTIYHWVRNNIEWQPAWGAMQNADLTLSAKRGNAMDIASLTLALLRASQIPARYVHGTIDVPAEQFKNWAGGFSDIYDAMNFASSGGVPVTGMRSGGQIIKVRIEHIWVEAAIDYQPSRGAKNRDADSWVQMDPSFKQYEYLSGLDVTTITGLASSALVQDFSNSGTINEAEGWVTGFNSTTLQNALSQANTNLNAYISTNLTNPSLQDIAGGRKTILQQFPVLPSSLPNAIVVTGTRYAELPASLRHLVTIELFDSSVDHATGAYSARYSGTLSEIGLKRLGITYVPATAADALALEDQIASGSTSLPAYLISMKPVIRLDDTELVPGTPITLGSDQYVDVILSSPIETKRISYSQLAGDEMVVGIDTGATLPDQVLKRKTEYTPINSAENLFLISLGYWAEADYLNAISATSFGVHQMRLPSIGLFSSPISVSYRFGIPVDGYYIKRVVDIKHSMKAIAGVTQEIRKNFMKYSGITESYLESSILEQMVHNWQGTGLSAAQVMMDANKQGIKIYQINANNAANILPLLKHSDVVLSDINSAIQAGMEVTVPEAVPVKMVGSQGSGYIMTDPVTGEGAYRIDGGYSGGSGEGPCAEPKPQPIVEAITAILLTIVVLAILASLVVASGGTAAPAAVPALPQIMATVGLTALTFEATAGEVCTPIPLPGHLGGPQGYRSGLCADEVIGNQYRGGDVCVNGVTFDALTMNSRLWEVKVIDFSNNADFIVDSQVDSDFSQRDRQLGAIVSCPALTLSWAVADSRHFSRQVERSFPVPLIEHRNVPECFSLPEVP